MRRLLAAAGIVLGWSASALAHGGVEDLHGFFGTLIFQRLVWGALATGAIIVVLFALSRWAERQVREGAGRSAGGGASRG